MAIAPKAVGMPMSKFTMIAGVSIRFHRRKGGSSILKAMTPQKNIQNPWIRRWRDQFFLHILADPLYFLLSGRAEAGQCCLGDLFHGIVSLF